MVLRTIEEYYDAVPRPLAAAEDIGPFTLFVSTDPAGWPYYARPRIDWGGAFTVEDVSAIQRRQRDLGMPESFEWVDEVTPGLLPVVRASGLNVELCPLLALPPGTRIAAPSPSSPMRIETLAADSPDLAGAVGAVAAAFANEDTWLPRDTGSWPTRIASGLVIKVGAFDDIGAVGGGSHSPRGTTTELTGIGVIPRARRRGIGAALTAHLTQDALARGVTTIFMSAQDDSVARVYERIGFVRVGTACIATSAP
ncbi:MAG: GNAT family N-acetyltransferase [Actinomycetota bacterium]|nr:GNAT family N-acetyltransferase [Actinomycetota bacterium]